MKQGKIFIISASSGAGKTTLTNEVIKRLSHKFNISKVITYTTRSPRIDEINGKDYYFLTEKEFKQKLKADFFLETTKYNESFYGSPKNILENIKYGKSFILITDLKGIKVLKKLIPKAILIWINIPNLEILRQRLINRGDNFKKIEQRLKLAKIELKEIKKTDFFNYKIINDKFDQTSQKLMQLISHELLK